MSFFDDEPTLDQEDNDLNNSKTTEPKPKKASPKLEKTAQSDRLNLFNEDHDFDLSSSESIQSKEEDTALSQDDFAQNHEALFSDDLNEEQSNLNQDSVSFDQEKILSEQTLTPGSNTLTDQVSGRNRFVKSKIPAGTILVYLLKSYIDREDQPVLYDALIKQQLEIEELANKLYVRLVIDDQGGYAYLKSMEDEEMVTTSSIKPPQLLNRRQLSFFPSFILILLRKSLLDFEVSGQGGRLVMEPQEIINLVKVYFPNVNNEKNLDDRISRGIEELLKLGLLARQKIERGKTKIERLEVKRIINAIVTPEVLKNADELLSNYIRVYNENKDISEQDS